MIQDTYKGEKSILVSTFGGYCQFDPYSLVEVNLVPVIFNMSIYSL